MGIARTSLALRGLAVAVAIVTGAVAIIAGSAGVFTSSSTLTCLLPAAAGPVKPDTPVRYKGVTVGTVTEVDADFDGATLTVRMRAGTLERIPAAVRARQLPRTIFGDAYISLTAPEGASTGESLAAGSVVKANTSERTVRLYTAFSKLYELITAMHPAEIQVALDTLANVLHGRGAEVGKMIDNAATLGRKVLPMLDGLGADLRAVADLGRQLADAAPDMLAALEDAVALSETVATERGALRKLLTSGSALAGQAQRSLIAGGERAIELVHAADAVTEVLGRHPGAITDSIDAAELFFGAAGRAFSTGQFKIDAALTLDNPYPYTARDCPRYPGMAGPNCAEASPARTGDSTRAPAKSTTDRAAPPPGGTAGPVGGPREDAALRELAPLLPNAEKRPPPDVDTLGLLLGPLVRGQQVIVP